MGLFDKLKKKKEMTDKEFEVFVDSCYEELKTKQASLMEAYNLGQYDTYWFDQPSGTLQFKNNEKVELEFNVVPVGSWSGNSNSWMWAWANESVVDDLKTASATIKGLTDFTGYNVFSNGSFAAEEPMAHELTAMAVHYLDALGMYIVPSGNLKTFLALMELKQTVT